MRVLALVTDAFGGYGGIALYNRDVLKSLCEHSDISEVVAVSRRATEHSDIYPDNLNYDTTGIDSSLLFLKSVCKIIINNKKFDLILCCHINLMPLAWLIGRVFKIPIVLEIYGIEAWKPRGKFFAERLSSSAELVISISEYTRVRFLSWSRLKPEKCKILPNAIHAEQYGLKKKSKCLMNRYNLNGKKVLLTLGRIVSKERAKGFDEVLNIMPDLIKKHSNIVYVIAGYGEYYSTLLEKVSRMKLDSHVVFTGMIDEKEKADLYRLADVYVMPSRGEGFGFVFLEAMACGIPVIASKLDGSREAVLNGKLGEIVDPDNSEEIRNAILRALLKQKREIPELLEYFSYERFSSRLHGLVDSIVVRKK